MNKKGVEVWVSAVIYIAISIVVLTVILSAGMPLIAKMRDRNAFLQTKGVMHDMDNVIKTVAGYGEGSQRPFTINIQKGSFMIDSTNDIIKWEMDSTDPLGIEPDVNIPPEGALNIHATKTGTGYKLQLSLNYTVYPLNITSKLTSVAGNYNLLIKNEGNGEISIQEI
jgi:hypothetical protein